MLDTPLQPLVCLQYWGSQLIKDVYTEDNMVL